MDISALLISGMTPDLLYQLFVFAVSVIVLARASQTVIKNSVEIAKITRMGELVVGFLLLSIATTLPEMSVSISAILSNNVAVSIGNLLGSNVTNLGLILAIHAIILPIKLKQGAFERLPSILFMSSIIPLALLAMQNISSMIGIVLVSTYAFFAVYSIKKKITFEFPKKRVRKGLFRGMFYGVSTDLCKYLLLIGVGMAFMIFSSNYVVSSASAISSMMGMAESVIGATVIALGTSLPELSIALTAIRTRHQKLAIGNLIGSCLTNITLILGIVLVFSQAAINIQIFSTLVFFVIAITLVTWYFLTTGRAIDRTEGMMLLFVYLLFLISTFGVQLTIL
ncbi:MAG: sodium:calcium antiporter [Candidatus Aenigmatarchaeota archaeon]